MREILFRGKTNFEGRDSQWVYGSLLAESSNTFPIIAWDYDNDEDWIGIIEWATVDTETVGQYTGLTDRNGNKIFEGDIIKFAKNIYQVIFDVGSFALYDKDGDMISKIGGINDHCYPLMSLYIECCWEDRSAYDIEIIGNIHDNPELLN